MTLEIDSIRLWVRMSGKPKTGAAEKAEACSLWVARASRDGYVEQMRAMPLTPKKVAEVRKAIAAAAKNDPFTSEIPVDALHRRFE